MLSLKEQIVLLEPSEKRKGHEERQAGWEQKFLGLSTPALQSPSIALARGWMGQGDGDWGAK